MTAARIYCGEVLTRKTCFGMENLAFDEKLIGFERFLVANIAWEWAGIKNTRVCIVYDISENFKKFVFFKSKIFLRREPVLCRRIAWSVRRAKPLISIGFSIVSQGVSFGWFFETNHGRVAENFSI